MNVGLKINVGASIENVIPTVEDCLKDDVGEFYSTQNAVRLHEWLGGTSTLPFVLEKTDTLTRKVTKREVGSGIARYPSRLKVGDFTRIEQAKLAAGAIADELNKLMKSSKEAKTPAAEKAVADTCANMMRILQPIYYLNASCLFFHREVPKHWQLNSIDVLDILIDFVITQRRRSVYQTDATHSGKIDQNLFLRKDLEMVLIEVHRAAEQNVFPSPESVRLEHGLLSVEAFREMASAISQTCNYVIPEDWHHKGPPSKIYFWAVAVLQYKNSGVEEAVVRPKLSSVKLTSVKIPQ